MIWPRSGSSSPPTTLPRPTPIDLIDAKFQNLSRHPDAGRRRDELLDGLRSLPVGRYLIFYLQDDVCLRIVRVLPGARDVEAVFADPAEENQP